MKTLGVITTTLTAAIAVVVAVVTVRSLPDIRRYFKMRSM
ncbi:MAG: hypothetical protein QOI74_2167 [Micromonosporaceae bacterium]|jgi:hypothetical protein|nr:hypothetical protein [Micromonosporaceae bacterium]MDT5037695.1 hypothetical protein [Micromonosporaceae bacterium]